jgi:glucose-1-phosphate adenylyltransferase
MGIYVFNAAFLYEQLIRDAATPGSSHDFGKDVLPYIVPRYRVFAHSFAESCVGTPDCVPYWRDVGTLEAYWEANMELTKVVPELNMYDAEWPIWTYQEQLPPAKFVFDDDARRGMAVDSLVSGGCVISGATVRRSLLFTNVRVDIGSVVEDSAILPNTVLGRNVTVKRAIVDKQCVLADGMTVGVDAEADRKRFNVTPNGITLVTPDMLGQNEYRIR